MTTASWATGRSLVPAVRTTTRPLGVRGVGDEAGSQNVRPTRSCSAWGKSCGEVGGLLGVDARGEAILARLDELTDDALDPLRRLAFAEDHFGEAAALTAVQIDLGETEVRHGRFMQSSQRRLDARAPGM